jgi:hypothetical protein
MITRIWRWLCGDAPLVGSWPAPPPSRIPRRELIAHHWATPAAVMHDGKAPIIAERCIHCGQPQNQLAVDVEQLRSGK